MKPCIALDKGTAEALFTHYRKHRDGIRNREELATLCLICGSVHVVPHEGHPGMLVCRNCGFPFYRYPCPACGRIVDGRDPQNPGCRGCELRTCSCGACGCAGHTAQERTR
jgi:hypothetical protein